MKWPNIIPAPSTFTEGQRAWFGCLVALAGIFYGIFAAAMVVIFVWGGWPEDRYEQIIGILGWGFMMILGIIGMVVLSLSLGGPVGRFKGGVSKEGLNFEADGDGVAPSPTIVQATATATVPASKPGDANHPEPPEGYIG